MRLTAADALLGHQHVVQATWFYQRAICAHRLQSSLDAFLASRPEYEELVDAGIAKGAPGLAPGCVDAYAPGPPQRTYWIVDAGIAKGAPGLAPDC